ncbi:NAC domain containing protein 47 [Abeliophyllum distichum]|uniref:NAC domain containing protein 47 n=1 Tax=Abeliophyllum distichum TaxID=126358 RepID=A0ABD1PDN0_9LAMI
MFSHHGQITDLPIGYRFLPKDEELIDWYLRRKISNGLLPADVIKDIDGSELYGKHPKNVVDNISGHQKSWYFFTHHNEGYDEGENKGIRIVGDGIGFWRGIQAEDSISNSNGEVYASKTHWKYFEGPISKGKRTHWMMEEYRLRNNASTSTNGQERDQDQDKLVLEWVLVRIRKGKIYRNSS